jgi:hypothetical protein
MQDIMQVTGEAAPQRTFGRTTLQGGQRFRTITMPETGILFAFPSDTKPIRLNEEYPQRAMKALTVPDVIPQARRALQERRCLILSIGEDDHGSDWYAYGSVHDTKQGLVFQLHHSQI